MTQHLQGKVALVTGATRGIGKGIAIGLGEAGATVYITGRSINSNSTNVAAEVSGSLADTKFAVETAGGICIPVSVDHGDDQQVELLFQRIDDEHNGQIDLLVNNVYGGVSALRKANGKPFWSCETQLWDACNYVGLRSHYIASVLAARMMVKRKQGLICTISSWGGLSYIFGAAYGAGKSAGDRLAADMAMELKRDNVTSVAIWPGIVGTEQIAEMAAQMQVDGFVDPQSVVFTEGYNWETPLLTGRAIAALAGEKNLINRTGKVQIVAELAQRYGLVDADGNRPVSLRSLRFIIPFALPFLRKYGWLVPDIKVPWWVLLNTALSAPRL